jgi:hypothetical protein
MRVLIIFILFVTVCFSCGRGSGCRYCDLADNLMNAYSKEVRKTKNLLLFGSGGSMTTDVRVLSPSYEYLGNMDLCQARFLYIETVEGLIRKVNNNEEIRPYLHNYPFTEKNIALAIGFIDKQENRVKEGYIALVFMLDNENGLIYYNIYNSETEMLETIYIEPYEEALKIVNEQKAKTELLCE